MDTSQITRLEEQGEPVALRSGIPISIQDPRSVWLLLEGKLDLYLVEMQGGEPIGARHHFLRVEAGNRVIGLGQLSDAKLGVIANPAVASKLLRLDITQLQSAAAASPDAIVPLIEGWVEALGAALADKASPKNFQLLSPGAEVSLDGKPTAVLPLNGIVWVRLHEGDSRLLGEEEVPSIQTGKFFPVSRMMWLRCAPQTQLGCLDTRSWMAADPRWTGLQHFQEQAFTYLALRIGRDEQKEKARLKVVAEADSNTFEAALYKLAEPLQGESESFAGAQSGATDPLLQVCRMVTQARGIPFPAAIRAGELSRQRDPVSAMAQAARLRTRQVMLKGAWWTFESEPMVAFLEQDKRPVALLPVRRGYQLYDPVSRSKMAVDEELAGKLQGFAYVFYRPFPPKALSIRDVLSFGFQSCGADATTIVLMGAGAGLLGMVTPIFTGIIFDTLIPGAQRSALEEMAIFLVISALAMALLTLTRSLATLRLQSRMESSIQAAVWDRLLALPVSFFRNFTSGDLARRSLGISQIREALTGSALASILTGMFSVTSCALMFYYDWRLALVGTALVVFSALVCASCGWVQVRILREVSSMGGRISGMTLQFINGISKFRVAGTESRAFAVWAREFANQRVLTLRARKLSNGVAVFNSAFPVVAWSVIFYSAISLMKTSGVAVLTTGEFLAFMAAFVQFSTGALELNSAFLSVLNVVPLYERAKPILTSIPEVVPSQTAPRELIGNISIHHVNFRYRDDGPLVLNDLSLNVCAGQFAAIVGPSGSGKSTVFRLLLGFETPSTGGVYFDGQDLAELDVQAVRRQLGVVMQNARLITGSIFRNIVGDGTLTIDDAWDAARLAGLESDLKAMPMGMHTVVSEGGGGLSGGQRQRLLIARAIVHRPRIILFDEATSALDNRTQAIVSHSLKALNATRVVIAHRLSTVMHADRIFVLDKGLLVESGSYNELMAKDGLFTQMAKRQLT